MKINSATLRGKIENKDLFFDTVCLMASQKFYTHGECLALAVQEIEKQQDIYSHKMEKPGNMGMYYKQLFIHTTAILEEIYEIALKDSLKR